MMGNNLMKVSRGTLIAILRDVDPVHVPVIAEVLMEQGINWLEVSMSEETKGLESVRILSREFGHSIHLGAGTVISNRLVDKAVSAGAAYIITPGWDRELVRYAVQQGVSVIPGVYSPSDIMQATAEGIEVLKLFPAASLGLDYIKNLFGPFPGIHLMAVGGIGRQNLLEYYKAGCMSFAIGSDLVPRGAAKEHLETIRKNASEYRRLMGELR
jgi:2-dehydro-3-deoxyphosphogluconate aldolase/(4S)-4-hydroxy-2-oxoglutarate aldolase